MKIDYIIPTINRPSLKRTLKSIELENLHYGVLPTTLICDTENSAGENRNISLEKVQDSDWIVFVDDDDYLENGHSLELNNDFDVVVLTMQQENKIVPNVEKFGNTKASLSLQGNIGINFALKTSFYLKHNFKFDNFGIGEDFRFFTEVLKKTDKIKITEKIYYHAEKSNHYKKQEQMKTLKGVKYGLYIGTPVYSEEVKVAYMDSMVSLSREMQNAGIPVIRQHIMNTSLITKARNECLSNFMNNTSLDYFIFIDADISFDPLDVIKLMNYDLPFIAGTYPKKSLNWQEIQQCFVYDTPESSKELFEKTSQYTIYEKNRQKIKDNLLEVNRVGTGFMMFKRDLIKKLEKKYPELMYEENGNKGYGFFESEIKNKEHISEDYAFCERVKSVGEKIMIDTSINLIHHGGNVNFYGNYNNYKIFEKNAKKWQ